MVYNTVNQWEYSTLQYRARKQLKDRRVNRTGGISYRVKIAPLNSSRNTPPLELQTNKQTNKQIDTLRRQTNKQTILIIGNHW